jgi:hypothetical protein
MIGIYSSLAARSDFDRLLERLRTFPEGEDAYYEARINDALRRDDKEGAMVIIDEASTNPRLSAAKKERLVTLLQSLRREDEDSPSNLDRAYTMLKTTFDEAPESLKPQAFFLLAILSLERDQPDQARDINARLEKLEGSDGTMWRYVNVRLMLLEPDPDYDRMRKMQDEIADRRPDWDMAYILRTLIEEQYLTMNPGDPATITTLIGAYRAAVNAGNTRPDVWQRLAGLYDIDGKPEEARDIIRQAALRGVMLEARSGQLPQPYGRMYSQVLEAINTEDSTGADMLAQQCIRLAERRGERQELIFVLHLMLGKVFLDATMFDSAIRHLSETAKRGGTYVYPLAVCEAKSGDIDGGFTLLLDEIDLMPSAMPTLLPAILVLLAQVQPSEAVYERIDRLMNRIERGERLTMRGNVEASTEDHVVPLGTRWVDYRRIQSFVIRFPEKTDNFDPSVIQFLAPDELGEEE